jgi:hypothetical protein
MLKHALRATPYGLTALWYLSSAVWVYPAAYSIAFLVSLLVLGGAVSLRERALHAVLVAGANAVVPYLLHAPWLGSVPGFSALALVGIAFVACIAVFFGLLNVVPLAILISRKVSHGAIN